MKSPHLSFLALAALATLPLCADEALDMIVEGTPMSELRPPAQDQGRAYTRSALLTALEALADHRAFSAHSRYAIFYGKRVRLYPEEPLEGDAHLIDGSLYIPTAFAPAVLADRDDLSFDTAPAEIAARYVYTITAPEVALPKQATRLTIRGIEYVKLDDLAAAQKTPLSTNERGLAILGENPPALNDWLLDTVISSFDTPDTLTDPEIARNYIPLLKRQGDWTQYVETTPEQLAQLEGPEHEWTLTSLEDYDFTGFAPAMLGSKVPEPGVYPRVLFSPEDLPMLRQRMADNRIMQRSFIELEVILQKTWLNPEHDAGKLFHRLVNGGPITLDEMRESDLKRPLQGTPGMLKDQKKGFYCSHVNHNNHALLAIAYYALLTDDEALGKQVAKAIVNYALTSEYFVDMRNEKSDSEFGIDTDRANAAATGWRGMTGTIAHMQMPFQLDFAGCWMTPEQKEIMRRVIAKATYGKADSHSSGPLRWQENNHATWHTTIGLAQMTIEGLPGHDVECEARNLRTIRAFLEYGIDPSGVVYESNGKSGAGFQFQTLNMIALARRGHNTFGHPHWRELMNAQMACTSPNGTLTVTSGTFSGVKIDPAVTSIYKTFHPSSRSTDFILSSHFPDIDPATMDLDAYRAKMEKNHGRTRLPVLGNPLGTFTTLYDTDWVVTPRSEVPFTGDLNDTHHGILSTYSDATDNAAWLLMQVRAQHYVGAGHHHADAGLFYFAADGINWITETPINYYYHGYLHNNVLIDGISMANGPAARADYLGAQLQPGGAFATADLSYAYNWRWTTQVVLWDESGWWSGISPKEMGYQFEPDPEVVKAFKGTQHRKMRIWWPSYNFSNWIPTVRAPYNPVEYVYRSTGLVKGPHPYGLIVDDVKKDAEARHYQWTAATGDKVWTSELWSRNRDLPRNQIILGHEAPFEKNLKPSNPRHHGSKPNHLRAKDGDPQLLVCFLNYDPDIPTGADPRDTGVLPLIQLRTEEGPRDHRALKQQFYDQIVINQTTDTGTFRVLLLPFTAGETLPKITYDHASETATIQWPDQTDTVQFTVEDGRTRTTVQRDGETVITSL